MAGTHRDNVTRSLGTLPKSMKRTRRLVIVIVLGLSAALVWTGAAIADSPNPEWPSSSSSLGYTDDRDFNRVSAESTYGDHTEFSPIVNYLVHREWGLRTDLSDRSLLRDTSPASWIDVYWYMTPGTNFSSAAVIGDTICKRWKSTKVCDQNRVRFAERLLVRKSPTYTTTQKYQVVCHEFGHAVGFGHGTTGRSCMDGGGNGKISWYEIQKVNGRY